MSLFNIYAGLGGSFGGAIYRETMEFDTLDDAENYAYHLARDEYESYEGLHGIKSWGDIADEMGFDPEDDDMSQERIQEIEEEISNYYNEEVEQWIDYYAVPVEEETNFETQCPQEND